MEDSSDDLSIMEKEKPPALPLARNRGAGSCGSSNVYGLLTHDGQSLLDVKVDTDSGRRWGVGRTGRGSETSSCRRVEERDAPASQRLS